MQCSCMHSYASMTFERVPCLVSRERIKVTSLISQIARHVPSCDTTSFFKIQGDAKIMEGKKRKRKKNIRKSYKNCRITSHSGKFLSFLFSSIVETRWITIISPSFLNEYIEEIIFIRRRKQHRARVHDTESTISIVLSRHDEFRGGLYTKNH